MIKSRALVVAVPLLALLSACDRSDPPSERLERAAEELVTEVEGEPLPGAQLAGPYAPRDECSAIPGGEAFVTALHTAVEDRNTDAFVALAADDVKLDFGGGGGTQQLRELLDGTDGEYWDMLEELLSLGCAADAETGISFPWYWGQEIPVDSFMGSIVTAENVPLRNAPASDAPVIARISWEAVEQIDDAAAETHFVHVSWDDPDAADPVEGYILQSRLRSIIDHRLLAARRNNRWRIVSIVAGD